jgi:hypothetical protein
MTKRAGRQTSLGDALGKMVERMDRKTGGAYTAARIAETWASVVGPSIATHTGRPVFRDGELHVATDSAAWATELSAMSESLKDSLNKEIGKPAVRSVRFTVSRSVSVERMREQAEEDTARFYAPDDVQPVALSPEELEEVDRSVSAIKNEALREAARSAAVKHREWSKGTSVAKTPQEPREGL